MHRAVEAQRHGTIGGERRRGGQKRLRQALRACAPPRLSSLTYLRSHSPDCQSGKRDPLPGLPPLRTVLESFPSYGSSLDKPFLGAGISALAICFRRLNTSFEVSVRLTSGIAPPPLVGFQNYQSCSVLAIQDPVHVSLSNLLLAGLSFLHPPIPFVPGASLRLPCPMFWADG